MEKLQITIKNLETGETIVDVNTGAIIGAIDDGEGTRCICLSACNGRDLAATAAGALQAANKAMADMPKSLAKITKKIGNRKINNKKERN